MHFSYFLLFYSLANFFNSVLSDFEILILHTNDMHSRFDETDVNGFLLKANNKTVDRYGGIARLRTAVVQAQNEANNENVPSLFLNAGDTFQGTAFYTMHKSKVVLALLPLLGLDAMSLGNHEFDDGVTVLTDYLNNIPIPVVACNLDFSQEYELSRVSNLHKSIVVEKNGWRIGIVGYLTPETKTASITGNVIFNDEIESIKKEVKQLNNQGVRIIIALGHSGFEVDKAIASNVPEVSLVIGGHTNTFLYTPPDQPPSTEKPEGPYPYIVTQKSGKKVPVVSAYAYTKYLGKLWAKFDENGNFISARETSNALLLNTNIALDESVQKEVTKWKRMYESAVEKTVGRTNVYLDGWKAKCKFEECNLGNFVTDAFVDCVAEQFNGTYGWTDAPIAIIQGGGLRSAMVSNKTYGNMTYQEILVMLPFRTPLLKVRIPGSTLRKALEYSVSNYRATFEKETPNSFLQVAGIHVIYDMKNPSNQRIVQVDVRCSNCSVPEYSPLNDQKLYTVIMSSFLYHGGDGFDMFRKESVDMVEVKANQSIQTDSDAFAKYFEKMEVIYPEISGRIKILNENLTSAGAKSLYPVTFVLTEILMFALLGFVKYL